MHKFKYSILAVLGVLLIFTVLFGSGLMPGARVESANAPMTVVASGLHSPRGLAFGPGDILYVAQAGDADHLGSIIEIRNSMSKFPISRTIVQSVATIGDEGEFLGVDGISVLGRGKNQGIYALTGLSPRSCQRIGRAAMAFREVRVCERSVRSAFCAH